MKPVIFITGPTCSGKSSVGVSLSKLIDGEVVSADSMQFYRGMDIGTSKITTEEMRGVRHHLIDIADPDSPVEMGAYKGMAMAAIEDIRNRGKYPIIVGCTRLCIESILFEYDDEDAGLDPDYRDSLKAKAESGHLDELYSELVELDPRCSSTIHPNNLQRITRALEYIHSTGRMYSEYASHEHRKQMDNFRFFVLEDDREALYKRIDLRVEVAIEQGGLEEVKKLLESGISRDSPLMQALGYKQASDYFSGDRGFDHALALTKMLNRRVARRQISWLRHFDFAEPVDIRMMDYDADRIASHIAASCGIDTA